MRYAALPPYDIGGTVDAPYIDDRFAAINQPAFRASRFSVAAHYGRLYPTYTVWDGGRFYFSPYYYRNHYPYWGRVRVDLPTPDMLRRVVPEGTLEVGGEIEGFLYFENIHDIPAGTRVTLHADLSNAANGAPFATAQLPFIMNGEDAGG